LLAIKFIGITKMHGATHIKDSLNTFSTSIVSYNIIHIPKKMHIYEGVLVACYLLQYVRVNGVTPFRVSLDKNTTGILTTYISHVYEAAPNSNQVQYGGSLQKVVK
jgi:hypothetical protein